MKNIDILFGQYDSVRKVIDASQLDLDAIQKDVSKTKDELKQKNRKIKSLERKLRKALEGQVAGRRKGLAAAKKALKTGDVEAAYSLITGKPTEPEKPEIDIEYTGDRVYGINKKTGEPVWEKREHDRIFELVQDDLCAYYVDGRGRGIHVINKETGNSGVCHVGGDLDSLLLLEQGVLAIGTRGSGIYSLNIRKGEHRWHNRDIGDVHDMIEEDGVIYASSDFDVIAVDARTGNTIWKKPCNMAGRIAKSGDVLGVSSSYEGLLGLDARTGKEIWRNKKMEFFPGGHLVVADDKRVYSYFSKCGFFTDKDRVSAHDSLSGKTLWEFPARKHVGALLAKKGKLYVGSIHGRIEAIDAETGRVLWKKEVCSSGCLPYDIKEKDGILTIRTAHPHCFGPLDSEVYMLNTETGKCGRATSLH